MPGEQGARSSRSSRTRLQVVASLLMTRRNAGSHGCCRALKPARAELPDLARLARAGSDL